MLDLVRLSPRALFPPGGMELYRQIALLTGMAPDREVLDVACGKGVALEYFVREFDVHGSGVDRDPALIEAAEGIAREAGLSDRLHFQTAPSDALPYRDEIFDVSIGEIGLASQAEPADAVRELVRVTRPGGFVVLVQLVWKAPVDEDRRRTLAGHLGTPPRMLVEWKRLLREAGVEDLHTEDWSDERTSFRANTPKPFPDFAEIFSPWEKAGILRRAWTQWGWRGVRSAVERERAVHRLLTHERILGLDLIRGRKTDPALVGEPSRSRFQRAADASGAERPTHDGADTPESDGGSGEPGSGEPGSGRPEPRGRRRDVAARSTETAGLPLFGEEREGSEGPA